MHVFNVHAGADEVASAAAQFLASTIRDAIEQRGRCLIALPGGNTPAPCLQRLAAMDIDWNRVEFFLGDERCLPVGDAERNDTMLESAFWSLLKVVPERCHRMPAELGAEAAATAYAELLDNFGPLDIAFLGMGEDGHTASLFPGNAALTLGEHAVPVHDSPKPPPDRVSMSADYLRAAAIRVVLVIGAGKADIMARIRQGESFPVNSIGDIHWFLDTAANGPDTPQG